jgi:hypothetical protein
MVRHAITWLLLANLLQGCHLIFPFSLHDAGSESHPADAATNVDGLTLDGLGDAGLPPDLGAADGKTDAPLPTAPCNAANSVNAQLFYAVNMVLCQNAVMGRNQCQAEDTFCNVASGWRMCNAIEFLTRGGKTKPASVTAWIKSCIRSGSSPALPTNDVCKCNSQTNPPTQKVMWACSDLYSTSSSGLYIGAATDSICHRIGTTSTANEGMWRASSSEVKTYAAVCCYN